MNAKRQSFWLIASVLLLLLVLVFTRDWLQAHMARHMLLQMPALALAARVAISYKTCCRGGITKAWLVSSWFNVLRVFGWYRVHLISL
jgi:hypothetical protein